jgi:hypothetical protein
MSPVTHQMMLIASAFILGELVLAIGRARGQPFLAVLAASAPRFLMAAILGAAIGYVLSVFGIKVTP